jgi:hypothetical protein
MDTVQIQPQSEPDQALPKPRRKGAFTPEMARIYAYRSAESKRRAKANADPAKDQSQPDPYLLNQLARVRGHLARIDQRLDEAIDKADAQAIERLTRSRASLEEAERRFSSRSLPPVLRVAEVKTRRSGGLLGELPE